MIFQTGKKSRKSWIEQMLLRLIILGLIVYFLFRILRPFFSSLTTHSGHRTPERRPTVVDDMVQDPHCGVYIARKEAFSTRAGDKVLYFCSEECAKNFFQKDKGDVP